MMAQLMMGHDGLEEKILVNFITMGTLGCHSCGLKCQHLLGSKWVDASCLDNVYCEA